jgi:hypothetical protein
MLVKASTTDLCALQLRSAAASRYLDQTRSKSLIRKLTQASGPKVIRPKRFAAWPE